MRCTHFRSRKSNQTSCLRVCGVCRNSLRGKLRGFWLLGVHSSNQEIKSPSHQSCGKRTWHSFLIDFKATQERGAGFLAVLAKLPGKKNNMYGSAFYGGAAYLVGFGAKPKGSRLSSASEMVLSPSLSTRSKTEFQAAQVSSGTSCGAPKKNSVAKSALLKVTNL